MSASGLPRYRLAAIASVAAAMVSPTTQAEDPSPPPPARDRIESIELAANGTGGVIRTIPVYMSGTEHTFSFGEGACRTYNVSPETLEALHAAMRARQPVRISGPVVRSKDGVDHECVDRVIFFPPEPS